MEEITKTAANTVSKVMERSNSTTALNGSANSNSVLLDLVEKLAIDVICPICSEFLIEAITFPCFHNFCPKCTQILFEKTNPKDELTTSITCTICMQSHNLSANGAQGLPRNIAVESIAYKIRNYYNNNSYREFSSKFSKFFDETTSSEDTALRVAMIEGSTNQSGQKLFERFFPILPEEKKTQLKQFIDVNNYHSPTWVHYVRCCGVNIQKSNSNLSRKLFDEQFKDKLVCWVGIVRGYNPKDKKKFLYLCVPLKLHFQYLDLMFHFTCLLQNTLIMWKQFNRINL